MSKDMRHATPPLLKKTPPKDPMTSSWRTHMKDGEWVPDVAVNECMLCRIDFSFWSRKHHCRRCGAVVCFSCSGSRTKFIYKEVTPSNVSKEECRVCDGCIRYIDDTLALGLSKRFGKTASAASDENQDNSNNVEEQEASFFSQEKILPAEGRNNRGVLTVGRYRAEIKESEGNRYIRDNDL